MLAVNSSPSSASPSSSSSSLFPLSSPSHTCQERHVTGGPAPPLGMGCSVAMTNGGGGGGGGVSASSASSSSENKTEDGGRGSGSAAPGGAKLLRILNVQVVGSEE